MISYDRKGVNKLIFSNFLSIGALILMIIGFVLINIPFIYTIGGAIMLASFVFAIWAYINLNMRKVIYISIAGVIISIIGQCLFEFTNFLIAGTILLLIGTILDYIVSAMIIWHIKKISSQKILGSIVFILYIAVLAISVLSSILIQFMNVSIPNIFTGYATIIGYILYIILLFRARKKI